MVLEDGSTGPSYGYDSPSSGMSLSPDQKRAQFEADYNRFDYPRYVHPLPILGPLFGFGERRVRRMVASEWLWARDTLQRPLRHEEEDALAGATCKQMRTMSYAGPVGLTAGLYRAFKTRETWRLPFWGMGKDFDPAVVKFPGVRQLLQGEAAKMFWTILRNGLYGANGVVFGMCFFLSFSASSVSVAIQRDPRLKDFREALRSRIQESRRPNAEIWKNDQGKMEGRKPDFYDSSPSSGQGMDDSYATYSSQGQASGSSQDPYEQSWNRTSTPARRPTANQTPSSQAPNDSPSGGDFMDDLDDAPPVASSARTRRPPSQPTGSAWERVRRQAAEGSNDEPRTPRESSAPRRESYSFSDAEENRQLAQSEAQREFDARVERERQGGDFDQSRGRRRDW